jgi:acid stress-induced BolA-like protein IbaG/YrbA
MDQKLLVSYIKPVIKSLQDDGLKITRAEVWPGDINGYFTLAISAEWAGDSSKDRVLLVLDKIRALIPHEVSKYIVNKYTFDTPESIEKYIDYYVTGRDYFRVQSLYPPKLEAVAA